MMSCIKLKFESLLVLLLFSYDGNWPKKSKEKSFLIYFMLIAWEIICNTKDIQVAVTRYCVTATRCLRKTLHCPKKASVQPWIPIHCLPRVKVS